MPIDINNKKSGTWFPYPLPSEDEDVSVSKESGKEEKVCFALIGPQKFREIEDATRNTERAFKQPLKASGKVNVRAALQAVEYPVDKKGGKDLRYRMQWDAMIPDYVLYDSKGSKIPVSLENKLKLINNSAFFIYTGECLEMLTADDKENRERLEKNCISS